MIYFYMFYILLCIMNRHCFFSLYFQYLVCGKTTHFCIVILYPTTFLKSFISSECFSIDSLSGRASLVKAATGHAQITGMENGLQLVMGVGEVPLQKSMWDERYCHEHLWKIESATPSFKNIYTLFAFPTLLYV